MEVPDFKGIIIAAIILGVAIGAAAMLFGYFIFTDGAP